MALPWWWKGRIVFDYVNTHIGFVWDKDSKFLIYIILVSMNVWLYVELYLIEHADVILNVWILNKYDIYRLFYYKCFLEVVTPFWILINDVGFFSEVNFDVSDVIILKIYRIVINSCLSEQKILCVIMLIFVILIVYIYILWSSMNQSFWNQQLLSSELYVPVHNLVFFRKSINSAHEHEILTWVISWCIYKEYILFV